MGVKILLCVVVNCRAFVGLPRGAPNGRLVIAQQFFKATGEFPRYLIASRGREIIGQRLLQFCLVMGLQRLCRDRRRVAGLRRNGKDRCVTERNNHDRLRVGAHGGHRKVPASHLAVTLCADFIGVAARDFEG